MQQVIHTTGAMGICINIIENNRDFYSYNGKIGIVIHTMGTMGTMRIAIHIIGKRGLFSYNGNGGDCYPKTNGFCFLKPK